MQTDHTWKEAVAQIVLRIIETTGQTTFDITQVYAFEHEMQTRFPGNRHVREKIRQSLQKLVADELITRSAKGIYQLNTHSPELAISTTVHNTIPRGRSDVPTSQRIVSVRLRNTLLAIEIKRRYQYRCQVCQYAVPLRPPVQYAEGHHLRPLGNGHNGPDVVDNIMVLCPNHHTMFDAGAAAIEPETNRIVHHTSNTFLKDQKLLLADWHSLDLAHVAYHYKNIFKF